MGKFEHIENLGKELCEKETLSQSILDAIDNTTEGIALLDNNQLYTYMNRTHEVLLGYNRKELLGKSWKVLYKESEVIRLEKIIAEELPKGGRWEGSAIAICKDGITELEQYICLTDLGEGSLVCNCRENKKK